MLNINKDQLNLLKEKEFSILFFHAKGCHHCESAKPVFELFSQEYPNIQFLSIELNEAKEYYEKYAEDIQAVTYEVIPNKDGVGNLETKAIAQFNEDSTPKMVKKYAFPSFYVHHTKAATYDNEYGFIGGFDGNNSNEARAVLDQLNQIMIQRAS
jgi:thiol-disulfide isomerase/thioredoxin